MGRSVTHRLSCWVAPSVPFQVEFRGPKASGGVLGEAEASPSAPATEAFYSDTLALGTSHSKHWGKTLWVWGLCPQRGPGQSPCSGVCGAKPPTQKLFAA